MDQGNDAVNTTSGGTAGTEAPAGAATSKTPKLSRRGQDAATARTTRLGSKGDRLAILMSELANCQTVGVKVKWAKSQTKPYRILLAIYDATICPKCNGFVLLTDAGAVNCQTPGCEYQNVEYVPDDLPERLAIEGAK